MSQVRVLKWRLVVSPPGDAYLNMAIDEAMLDARMRGLAPNTLRLYTWLPSAASVGYFQDMEQYIDLEACRRLGVQAVRRPTGGGAVYHDSAGELTYSVVADLKSIGASDTIGVYQRIIESITSGLKLLGIKASVSMGSSRECPNIRVGSAKISGSAQLIRGGYFLQHGTLLVSVDLVKMFTVLKHPFSSPEEAAEKLSTRISSISQLLGCSVSRWEVADCVVAGFSEVLGVSFERRPLTLWELRRAGELRRKYSSREWNLERRRFK
ncbi:MAG: lipoate--protein ligase family protein [Thermoproteota archaeon]|nr:MAG: lipoate--protein ligase family protein [Candidatus Korarchaeota archaeon]